MDNKLKVYKVNGGEDYADYGALTFEKKYAGRKVGEVAQELLGDKNSVSIEDGDDYFGISFAFETSDREAFLAQRDEQDYDESKHEKLFIEDEII